MNADMKRITIAFAIGFFTCMALMLANIVTVLAIVKMWFAW
ncbi:MAG: hypothetical protein VB062_04700 [Christensenella sp.]|nr:hypothetical protein [Christensenella sp.]